MVLDELRGKQSPDLRVVLIGAILTLGNLAICLHRSSRVYLFQQSLCLQYYLVAQPNHVSADWEVEESLCKIREIQSSLSMIEGLDTFLQLLPGKNLVLLLDLMNVSSRGAIAIADPSLRCKSPTCPIDISKAASDNRLATRSVHQSIFCWVRNLPVHVFL